MCAEVIRMHIEGFGPEWCISAIYHALDTPFWLGTLEHTMCNTLGAYHMQQAMCYLVQRDSSPFKFDRVEIAFIFALYRWLSPFTDEGEEETGVPGENPL